MPATFHAVEARVRSATRRTGCHGTERTCASSPFTFWQRETQHRACRSPIVVLARACYASIVTLSIETDRQTGRQADRAITCGPSCSEATGRLLDRDLWSSEGKSSRKRRVEEIEDTMSLLLLFVPLLFMGSLEAVPGRLNGTCLRLFWR